MNTKITEENHQDYYLSFNDRQAGISLIYCPQQDSFTYNVYCFESVRKKELYSAEYHYLSDALKVVNSEFETWELVAYVPKKSACSSCTAH